MYYLLHVWQDTAETLLLFSESCKRKYERHRGANNEYIRRYGLERNSISYRCKRNDRQSACERTDFFEVEKGERFGLEAPVDTIVADVSFVSLRRILEKAREFADGRTEFLVMLKPQFEARKEQLWKGVVKNEKMRREIIREFEGWLKWERFLVLKKRDNEVAGRNGNLERFYLLKMGK